MKEFKTKRINLKLYMYLIIFIIIFIVVFNIISNNSIKDILLDNFINEYKNKSITLNIFNTKDMLYNSFNKVISKDNLFKDISEDNDTFSDYVIDTNKELNSSEPIVYIYNTHQLEEYESSVITDYNVKPNVMIASYIFRENLDKLNIPSIVETSNVNEWLKESEYDNAYHATEEFARIMTNKYKSIKYLIDIHRDSIDYKYCYLDYEGKRYARVLFVVGFEHTYNNDNFASIYNELLNNKVKNISRGLLNKTPFSYYGTYNSNLEGKSVLIELGCQDNTLEEINNTIEILSEVLSIIIEEDNET